MGKEKHRPLTENSFFDDGECAEYGVKYNERHCKECAYENHCRTSLLTTKEEVLSALAGYKSSKPKLTNKEVDELISSLCGDDARTDFKEVYASGYFACLKELDRWFPCFKEKPSHGGGCCG